MTDQRDRPVSAKLKLSIIVPAFNEEKLIGATLGSIREAMQAFTEGGWETELIVCDNNSTDRTGELARAAGATVVFEPVNQIARARNAGAAAASGDWLMFVDADSQPSRELFEDALAAIGSGRYVAGGCTVKFDRHHVLEAIAVRVWNLISRTAKYFAGSFSFIEAATFREVGGFSQELFASEEIDLSKRLKVAARKRGKRLIILHRHPLLTSGRKVHLYSRGEYFRLLARLIWRPRETLTDRNACYPWYDGRR
jgi:glycosyltransferase involved in cell wall biosynthesis